MTHFWNFSKPSVDKLVPYPLCLVPCLRQASSCLVSFPSSLVPRHLSLIPLKHIPPIRHHPQSIEPAFVEVDATGFDSDREAAFAGHHFQSILLVE
ncbi:MAG: hypothetical protein RLZZ172_2278 [Bacteroidota bacterium]